MNRQFSLAGLLRLRQMQQDQAATGLARARSHSDSVRAREVSARRDLSDASGDVDTSQALHAIAAARFSSFRMLSDLQSLTADAQSAEDAAREEFTAARTRSVGLEKLQTRHDAEVLSADLRAEQAALDEIASTVWHRDEQQVTT
ncbi:MULTISPECIES: flagellar export protein FliJ [Arthrobacter]|uniref:Flagellar FliJ protein n=1 Tax=Arthrobacter oryzae TaxID=409290 RepID=A0A3N0CE34_9MICC|nr:MULTISPECIES: flagellar FliJ family protein [Arthrobacter]QYF91259.1 flagellar FliJ family protein [Arthrobacter sp. PAMC25284]RNL61559.1 flagellar export protein FliJ [Arthrobacter oryzae]